MLNLIVHAEDFETRLLKKENATHHRLKRFSIVADSYVWSFYKFGSL